MTNKLLQFVSAWSVIVIREIIMFSSSYELMRKQNAFS